MTILFDQGTPVPLRDALVGHTVETAYERGWSTFGNGALLDAADAASFDVLITTDQNLRHQQQLATRRMAVIVLPTTRWPEIQQHTSEVVAAIATIRPGDYRDLHW
jgi:hypothetical protein